MRIEQYRQYFPVSGNSVYLDNSGVAPVSTVVADKVNDFLREASFKGAFAYDSWMEKVEYTRKLCAGLVGCTPEEIAFVKSTSHGISIVSGGYRYAPGDNVVVYEKEFPSNMYPWIKLGREKGVEVRTFGASADGEITVDEIEKFTDSNTRLISVSSVQFTNGYRVDTESLGEFCRSRGIRLFVDSIQSLGVVPVDVGKEKIDFLAADGHKWLLAPEGTGIFYCSKALAEDISPPLVGWKSVVEESSYENINFDLKKNTLRFEEGSLNVMGIIALGASCEMILEIGIENIRDRVHYLGELVISNCKDRGFKVKSPLERGKRGGIVCFAGDFDPVEVKDRLREYGVMVNVRGGAIRVSPHFYNNEEDIEKLFHFIDKILN